MDEIKRDCVAGEAPDCEGAFTISKGEVAFYTAKKFELPKRCKPCRFLKKMRNEQNNG